MKKIFSGLIIFLFIFLWISNLLAFGERIKPSLGALAIEVSVPEKVKIASHWKCKVIFKNQSKSTLVLHKRFLLYQDDLKFEVYDPKGVKAKFVVENVLENFHGTLKSNFIEIAPYQTYSYEVELSKFYSFFKDNISHRFEVPGDYRLKVAFINYETGEKYGYKAWIGTVESKEVTFNVVSNFNSK